MFLEEVHIVASLDHSGQQHLPLEDSPGLPHVRLEITGRSDDCLAAFPRTGKWYGELKANANTRLPCMRCSAMPITEEAKARSGVRGEKFGEVE